MPGEDGRPSGGGDIPQLHRLIVTGRRQSLAIGGEGQRPDSVHMSRQIALELVVIARKYFRQTRGPAVVKIRTIVAYAAERRRIEILLPHLVGEFAVHVLAIGAYYIILAASWNMLAGFTGQFSLAQHGFANPQALVVQLLVHGVSFWCLLAVRGGKLRGCRGVVTPSCYAGLGVGYRAGTGAPLAPLW